MAIERLEENVEIVQTLSTYPNQEDGLSDAELKAAFDEGSKIIKDYLNDVVVPAVQELENYVPDTTLSVPGKAADAFTVGEEIRKIDSSNIVKTTEQIFTEKQKAQARENIGAAEYGTLTLEHVNQNGSVISQISVTADQPEIDDNGYVKTGVIEFFETNHDGCVQLAHIADGTKDDHAATVGQVKKLIEGAGSGGGSADTEDVIPAGWESELKAGVNAINDALCEAGANKSAFLFYSDAHWEKENTSNWPTSSKLSPKLLKYLYSNTGMTKTIFGGDIVHKESLDPREMDYLWEWRNQIKDLPNHHSVVGNHDDGNKAETQFTEKFVYGFLFAPEETPDIVRGEGSTYYYIDSPAEKTRYLYLDTAFKDISGLSEGQRAFVNDALISTPDNWHIVAIAHIWNEVKWGTSGNEGVGDLSKPASSLVSMFDSYNLREGVYVNCTGKVEFCIGGHVHRDNASTSSTGIPIIIVDTDSYNLVPGVTITKTTEHACVSGIIADYDNQQIHVVRIGRGESFTVFVSHKSVNYTNLLPTALDRRDRTSVLIGDDGSVGYLNKKRYATGTTNNYIADNIWDTTGLIPCTVGDTVRLKNIDLRIYTTAEVSSSGNHGGIIWLDANGAVLNSTVPADKEQSALENGSVKYVFDENGKVVSFYTPDWIGASCAYVQITAFDIKPNSIVTVNEVIE